MSLFDLINKIEAVDRTLQRGANNIASKVNELVGLGNYQVSNLFFTASAVAVEAPAFYYVARGMPNQAAVTFTIGAQFAAFSIYQIVRNFKLEKWEKSNSENAGDAIAVDFELLEAKRRVSDFTGSWHAKRIYFGMLTGSLLPQYGPFTLAWLSYTSLLLVGQYFREADHLKPTAKNRVFNFLKNLVPKLPQLKPNYGTPISLETQTASPPYASAF